jgi:Mrp family chromosome partitioning ATPase
MFLVSRKPRCEKDFVAALGQPILAARPLRVETQVAQAEQLATHWFSRRRLLPVVSATRGEGRTRFALGLARRLASLGVRTLLVDGDLRAPRLHHAFRLKNDRGLADFLAGREARLAQCGENLAVLVAGRTPSEPLEALASPRLAPLMRASATRFGAIVIDTPAAARGPDLQIFAALAGGALALARQGGDERQLVRLRRHLRESSAQLVGILLT